ncbi:hypothetical protein BH18THE2_BH18THE2_27250 [soil metagenome]
MSPLLMIKAIIKEKKSLRWFINDALRYGDIILLPIGRYMFMLIVMSLPIEYNIISYVLLFFSKSCNWQYYRCCLHYKQTPEVYLGSAQKESFKFREG